MNDTLEKIRALLGELENETSANAEAAAIRSFSGM
jgi:hypothetical protein